MSESNETEGGVGNPQNVLVDTDPRSESVPVGHDDALSLPYTTLPDFNAVVGDLPKMDLATSEATKEWLIAISEATQCLIRGNVYTEAARREDSKWSQFIMDEAGKISAGKPKISPSQPGGSITGESALFKLSSILGTGGIVQVPLWHTGIWVSLKAPSESALLELDRRMAREKVDLGRDTYGMIFSNSSVYIKQFLINFVLGHVYNSTLKDFDTESLRTLISVNDYPTLLWGILCTIYPKGYPLAQPCIANIGTCNHVSKAHVSISKLLWTDASRISDTQSKHMFNRFRKVTVQDLEAYQASLKTTYVNIKITDELYLDIRVPTLDEYIKSGMQWVNDISNMIESSFKESLKGAERNTYMTNQGKVTALRQYAHWILRIKLGEDGGEGVIDDRGTIDNMCSQLSAVPEIMDAIIEQVGIAIENSALSIVAIPNYECPSCHGEQVTGEGDALHRRLIPLEVEQIFFALTKQRLIRTLQHAEL